MWQLHSSSTQNRSDFVAQDRKDREDRTDRIRAMWVWSLALLTLPAWALPPCADIHTWHNVTAFRGTWKAQLSSINERALFYHPNCTEMGAAPTFQVMAAMAAPMKISMAPKENWLESNSATVGVTAVFLLKFLWERIHFRNPDALTTHLGVPSCHPQG